MPIEPAPSRWERELQFDLTDEDDDDLIAIGGDLEPGTLLTAYRRGLFPMGVSEGGGPPIGWWSPHPRGVLLPGALRVSRSLRAACRTMEIRVDTAFDEVVAGCADPSRAAGWITPAVASAYGALHALGWAHSVEAGRDGRRVGGLYGVAIGGLFAGESMFHRERDASKVALVGLVERFFSDGDDRRVIDTQWATAHLASLGVQGISRQNYLDRLALALQAPDWVADPARR